MQELTDSGQPLDLYYDVEAEDYTAALPAADEPVAARAITGKCLNSPARLYQYLGDRQTIKCFDGTGILNGSWPRAFEHSASAYNTSFWYVNGSGQSVALYAAAGNTAYYSTEVTVVSISRG